MKTDQYNAVRVDPECNADEFWWNIRVRFPELASSLSRNGCALVSDWLIEALSHLGAFAEVDDGPFSPLIDYGPSGEGFDDVLASRHECFGLQSAAFEQPAAVQQR